MPHDKEVEAAAKVLCSTMFGDDTRPSDDLMRVVCDVITAAERVRSLNAEQREGE